MGEYYYSFNDYLRGKFGLRVHRISLNAGFGCPNKDGTFSTSGCIFCNEKGFSRFTDTIPPIETQIETSIEFLKKRFGAEKFIAYFQNATNTHADIETLKAAYDRVRPYPDIVGLCISTRPDCVDEEKLDLLARYKKHYDVWIEYGLQSVHDATLARINRSHTFSQFLKALHMTSERGIQTGVHVILGLPGESGEDMRKTAETLARLPISGVKLHVLHVLRDTALEASFDRGEIRLFAPSEYVMIVCDFIERLHPECVILRLVSDARKDTLRAPLWINEKHEIAALIKEEFRKRQTRQGARYEKEKGLCIRKL